MKKNDLNLKEVSKLIGDAEEIITVDVYGNNRNIISDCLDELAENSVRQRTRAEGQKSLCLLFEKNRTKVPFDYVHLKMGVL